MEELTEVITAAECHPHQCNVFVYSSSKGTIRLCDMRAAALCDRHSKCKYCYCSDVMFSRVILQVKNYFFFFLYNNRQFVNVPLHFLLFLVLYISRKLVCVEGVSIKISLVFVIIVKVCFCLFQSLRSLRIQAADRFSLRSSPPSQTWSSVTADAIWWHVTTSPSKFGTSIWRTGQWRRIRCIDIHF